MKKKLDADKIENIKRQANKYSDMVCRKGVDIAFKSYLKIYEALDLAEQFCTTRLIDVYISAKKGEIPRYEALSLQREIFSDYEYLLKEIDK